MGYCCNKNLKCGSGFGIGQWVAAESAGKILKSVRENLTCLEGTVSSDRHCESALRGREEHVIGIFVL